MRVQLEPTQSDAIPSIAAVISTVLVSEAMSDGSSRKRKGEPHTCITCPVVFGSSAMHLGKKSEESATHRWKLYIKGPRDEDISTFVEKVVFTLHPSFAEPTREVRFPPFEVSETGWGEFEASLRVYFRDPEQCPLDLFHLIKLYPSGPPPPAGSLKKQPPAVVAEQYEEIVFCDPSEKFMRQLMAYSTRDSLLGAGVREQDGGGTVFDDSHDLERLVAIQNHISGEIEVAKARLLHLQAAVVEATQAQVRSAASKQPSEGAAGSSAGAGAAAAKAKSGALPTPAAARTGTTAGTGVSAGAGTGQVQAGMTAVGPAGPGARASVSQGDTKKPRIAVGKKGQQAPAGPSAGLAVDGQESGAYVT